MINPPLQTPLLLCLRLLVLFLSIHTKADEIQPVSPPTIARTEYDDRCCNISIPFSFEEVGCFVYSWFGIGEGVGCSDSRVTQINLASINANEVITYSINPYVFGSYKKTAYVFNQFNGCQQKALCSAAVTALVLPLCYSCWKYCVDKKRYKIKRRVDFFKQKLQEHQSSNECVVERTRLLTLKELDRATDHFNINRILGRGGQGIVYKGMLVDGTIVAIKKSSKLEDETQMKQFINEMVILSTINHRNVVKLLGCCLETEIPLLVYEFINNGTLSQHIHHPNEDSFLTWAMRLQIAADSAGAVAYLHSSSSTPVYHRDIKPGNILLDDKRRARVSDFGCSKTIEIDQTHTTTLVHGTFGYFDPEYFRSGIFTDKSDVYSFGVVLLELLTSKKPCFRDSTTEPKALVTEFFLHVRNSNLLDLLDPKVVKEAKEEELTTVVDLAKCCLSGSGRLRPTMKEVAAKLDMIIKLPNEMCIDQYSLRKGIFPRISFFGHRIPFKFHRR